MSLTLYYHPLSSFCHKVLIALYENGKEFEKRIINLGDEAQRLELASIWRFAKFPVIRDHKFDRDVPESSIIIEYLDTHFPGAHPLIPRDFDTALEVRLWDRVFDSYVQGPLQQIVLDRIHGNNSAMTQARATLQTAYRIIDRHLAERRWISKHGFSMADCAASPALFYAATLEAFPDECAHLRRYFDRLIARASVARVLEEAKPYFSMYPFAEAIAMQFR